MNAFGRRLRVQVFGESHGPGVGAVLDGVPPGLPVDEARVQADLDARRPGGPLVSPRQESDRVQVLSGALSGRATGAPLCLWIPNEDARPADYARVAEVLRPGRADHVQAAWSGGFADLRGGGHLSGRLTAPLVAAGSLAQALLDEAGVTVAGHVVQVGSVRAPVGALAAPEVASRSIRSPVRTAAVGEEAAMVAEVEAARAAGDSVGGVVEFVADGVPMGWGDPWMDPIESLAAHLLFALPGVRGVSFGDGFGAAGMLGSQHNDRLGVAEGRIVSTTAPSGGVAGGRTTGARLWGHVAFRPPGSIAKEQAGVDAATREPVPVSTSGRHDPCIAIRGASAVQAALRLVLADLMLLARQQEGREPGQAPGQRSGRAPYQE